MNDLINEGTAKEKQQVIYSQTLENLCNDIIHAPLQEPSTHLAIRIREDLIRVFQYQANLHGCYIQDFIRVQPYFKDGMSGLEEINMFRYLFGLDIVQDSFIDFCLMFSRSVATKNLLDNRDKLGGELLCLNILDVAFA